MLFNFTGLPISKEMLDLLIKLSKIRLILKKLGSYMIMKFIEILNHAILFHINMQNEDKIGNI